MLFAALTNKCMYKCKQRVTVNTHLASIHDINVNWHSCDMCENTCHDSNATWVSCTMCKYKCKKPSTLTRHYASKHEVVVNEKEPNNNSKMNAPDEEQTSHKNVNTFRQEY